METALAQTMRSFRTDSSRSWAVGLLSAAALLAMSGRMAVPRPHIPDTRDVAGAAPIHPGCPPDSSAVHGPCSCKQPRTRPLGGAWRNILVELDTNPARLQITEEQARGSALSPRIESLHAELEAAVQARARELESSRSVLSEARARVEEAEQTARFAENEEARLKQLLNGKLIAERDYVRALAESKRSRAEVEALERAVTRLEKRRADAR